MNVRELAREKYAGFQLCSFYHSKLKRAVEEGRGDPITEADMHHAWSVGYERDEWRQCPSLLRLPQGARVAILCPGPSLTTTWPASGYAATIAVNRAIKVVGWASWLVSWDSAPLRAHAERARVGVLGKREHLAGLDCQGFTADQSILPPPLTHHALGYSKLGALVLAAWLGAEEIHLFGDDMHGGTYCDGERVIKSGNVRWAQETELGASVALWLRKRGITPRRVFDARGAT